MRVGLKQEFRDELMEWKTWLTELRDKELVRKAMKMDIDLDDDVAIQPDEDSDELDTHYELVGPGYECLRYESRKELKRLMRERASVYRRERRERLQLVVAIAAGLTGAITGLIALLRR